MPCVKDETMRDLLLKGVIKETVHRTYNIYCSGDMHPLTVKYAMIDTACETAAIVGYAIRKHTNDEINRYLSAYHMGFTNIPQCIIVASILDDIMQFRSFSYLEHYSVKSFFTERYGNNHLCLSCLECAFSAISKRGALKRLINKCQ